MKADYFISNLDKVKLENKNLLPECSGIYYVVDTQEIIWYIGRSTNLRLRWNHENPHHRYHQLISIAIREKKQFFIFYQEIDKYKLNREEKKQIAKYQPCLNHSPVIKNSSTISILDNCLSDGKDRNINQDFSLAILSHLNSIRSNKKEFKDSKNIMTVRNQNIETIDISDKNTILLKKFYRHFISLEDDDIGLNIELEICQDSENRLFVRHYNLYLVYNWKIEIIKSLDDNLIEGCLLNLNSQCYKLSDFSLRWVGYQLNCEKVILIDKEDRLEIETYSVMLPFRMFVNLIEYTWLKQPNLSEILRENEDKWFKSQPLSLKLAKRLYDKRTTLHKLVEDLE